MPSPIITLTSDFGWRDGYVAAMKGVILRICPDATLVDVSHDMPPHDIVHAAFVLGSACPLFPSETVHVAVVDPGVGTARHPLLLTTPSGTYLAPDNGLLTYVLMVSGLSREPEAEGLSDAGVRRTRGRVPKWADDAIMNPVPVSVPEGCSAYRLDREEYWLKPLSNTFHGRDLFAPVAAHLASGVAPEELGEALAEVVCLDIRRPVKQGNAVLGRVIHVDRFGNLITNIRVADVAEARVTVEIEDAVIVGLSTSYGDAEGLLAIVGSHGYLEVARRDGNAAQHLGAGVGTAVKALGFG